MSSLPGTNELTGCYGVLNSPDTQSPHGGTQCLKLTTTSDADLQTALSESDPKIAGQITYEYTGAIENPSDYKLSYCYKYTSVSQDTSIVSFTILDTLATGASGDITLFWSQKMYKTSVNTWTNEVITLQADNTETPNKIKIDASSSISGLYNSASQNVGSTLRLDDFIIANASNGGSGGNGGNQNSLTKVTKSSFGVYPNPANDVLNFNLYTTATSIEISSLDGKLISKEIINGTKVKVNVSELTSGIYMYKITNEDGSEVTNKFVKK